MSSGTTFTVGGSGGNFLFTADKWNQNSTISFRTGGWIDAIIINGAQYGGHGGSVTSNIPINIGGVVNLWEARVSTDPKSVGSLSFLSFTINDQPVIVGNSHGGTKVFTSAGAAVRIVALHSGLYLDSITFQYV